MKIILQPTPKDTDATALSQNPSHEMPQDGSTRDSQLSNSAAVSIIEINRLFKQMEISLETVMERFLLSGFGEKDNLLVSVQGVIERMFMKCAMRMAQGNISQAARLLGINRNTLSRKLRAIDSGE